MSAGLFTTSSESYQFVTNKQIGQSGANSIALSGDVTGGLNISTADPAIALAAINAASQNQISALETLRAVGNRFSDVAENAVGAAQYTALNAVPLTPEQIAASRGDATKEQTQKTIIIIAGIVSAVFLIAVTVKKFKS